MSPSTRSPTIRRPPRKRKDRDQAAEKSRFIEAVNLLGVQREIPCDECFDDSFLCCGMASSSSHRSLRCAKCYERGKPCSYKSWRAVNSGLQQAQAKSESLQAHRDRLIQELSQVLANLASQERVVEKTRKDAEEKARCFVQEVEDSGSDELFAAVSDANALESALVGPLDPGLVSSMEIPSLSQIDRMLGITNET